MDFNKNDNYRQKHEACSKDRANDSCRDMKWQVLDSRYVERRPWLTVRCDKVKLPTGAVNDEYYVLEYPTWVNVIAITEDGRYIMERQYRHGIGMTCYEIVAGVCEEGEQPLESAKRELYEETGYTGGDWREIMAVSQNTSTANNICHCFVATGVVKTLGQHLDRTEDIEVHLMDESDVLGLLESGEIKQSLMAAPLYKYFFHKAK